MLRRFLAAALIVLVALILLILVWPQLFGLHRASGVAQLVSFRGLLIVAAVIVIVVLGFVAVLSPWLRRFAASAAVLLVAFSVLNGVVIASRGIGNMGFQTANGSTVTVLAWNTLGDAPGSKAIAQLAIDNGADIIALPETTEKTGIEVADALGLAGRPMQAFTVHYDLVSKARSTTLLVSEALGPYVVDASESSTSVLPTVIARPADGKGPTILAVHLVAPLPGEMAHWNSDLSWLADQCGGDNLIVAGDFNSTLDHFAGLGSKGAALGDCVDAADATGNAAVGTWPTVLPPLFGAAIDHVMATKAWRVTGMRVIENYDTYGSDHRPVLAQLSPSGKP